MERIERIITESAEIVIVDYTDCKETEMIGLAMEAGRQVVSSGNPICLLSIFNDKSYVTPKFMRQVENETRNALPFIKKQAVVGLNDTKKMILKGFNFLFRKNIQAFNTKEEAINFLVDDSTTDSGTFWDDPAKL